MMSQSALLLPCNDNILDGGGVFWSGAKFKFRELTFLSAGKTYTKTFQIRLCTVIHILSRFTNVARLNHKVVSAHETNNFLVDSVLLRNSCPFCDSDIYTQALLTQALSRLYKLRNRHRAVVQTSAMHDKESYRFQVWVAIF